MRQTIVPKGVEAGIPGAGVLQWLRSRPEAGILQWLGPKLEAGTEEEGGRQLPARRDRKGVMGDTRTPQKRQPITPRRPQRNHYELRRLLGRLRGQLEHARRQVVT